MMTRLFVALVVSLGFSGIAAATVLFNPTTTGSGVSIDNLEEVGLLCPILCSTVGLDFSLYDLDSMTNALNVGDSWTFNFFDVAVNGLGTANFNLTATLAFLAPGSASSQSGSGHASTLFGQVSSGHFTWDGPQIVNVGDTSFSVALSDIDEFGMTEFGIPGIGNTATVKATVKLLASDGGSDSPVPVPEPGVLSLLGAGLLGLGLARGARGTLRRRPRA